MPEVNIVIAIFTLALSISTIYILYRFIDHIIWKRKPLQTYTRHKNFGEELPTNMKS